MQFVSLRCHVWKKIYKLSRQFFGTNAIAPIDYNILWKHIGQKNFKAAHKMFGMLYDDEISESLATSMLKLYGKFNKISEAEKLFNKLIKNVRIKQDLYFYATMISIYHKTKNENKIIDVYKMMKNENLNMSPIDFPHIFTILLSLNKNLIRKETLIYDEIIYKIQIQSHKIKDVRVKNSMIRFFSKIGHINESMRIFNSILNENKTIVTYGSMMHSYNEHEMYDKTTKLFNSISNDGKYNGRLCYLMAMIACRKSKNISLGKEIYHEIIHHEKYCDNVQLLNSSIQFFSKIGEIDECEKIFNKISHEKRTSYTHNIMMQMYAENDMHHKALEIFKGMNQVSDDATYIIALIACSHLKYKKMGKHIHHQLNDEKCNGFRSIQLMNALISFYGQIGKISAAEKIYDQIGLKERTSVTYNTMLSAYAQNKIYKAETFFNNLMEIFQHENENIMRIPYRIMMTAYQRNGMYGKALKLFNANEFKGINDTASYNITMTIYRSNGEYNKALNLFLNAKKCDMQLNALIYASALDICGDLSYMAVGEEIINQLKDDKHIDIFNDIKVQSSIISFYGRSCHHI